MSIRAEQHRADPPQSNSIFEVDPFIKTWNMLARAGLPVATLDISWQHFDTSNAVTRVREKDVLSEGKNDGLCNFDAFYNAKRNRWLSLMVGAAVDLHLSEGASGGVAGFFDYMLHWWNKGWREGVNPGELGVIQHAWNVDRRGRVIDRNFGGTKARASYFVGEIVDPSQFAGFEAVREYANSKIKLLPNCKKGEPVLTMETAVRERIRDILNRARTIR
jgi:hypothetical protein